MITLTKHAVKLGNSAGILLPKDWLGKEVKAGLLGKPIDIKRDILRIIEPFSDEVIGIYITGSYARGEQTKDSDIDILIITENKNKLINSGKYHIIATSLEEIKKALNENIITILPMLKEAKAILNKQLLEELKTTEITYEKLKWHIETSKSALKIAKSLLDLDGETVESPSIIYSLILRFREAYIADCLLKNKDYSTKSLMKLLNKHLNKKAIEELLKVYRYERDNKKTKFTVLKEDAEKLYNLVKEMIYKQEEIWEKKKESKRQLNL